jgi:tripartite-type tricarboxylate transporter receptor subunit TctC
MTMRSRAIVTVSMLLAVPIADGAARSASADSAVADFYRGKTLSMVIGSATGGGFDAYARLIGRYMTKHLPGNPGVVPQNLPGSGGFNAGYRVAVQAPQDGTHVGAVHPTTIVDPVLGDPRKSAKPIDFAYLGSASTDVEACFLRTDAPIKSMREAYDKEVILGASNLASSSREYAALLKHVLGMKVNIVSGYNGTAQIILAVDRGEVQGLCGASYLGVVAARPDWFTNNFVRVVSYQGNKTHPDYKWMAGAVPTVTLAKTDEQRQILTIYDSQEEFARPYVTGPTVPRVRIEALRLAFMSALDDSDLRREAAALGLQISPVSGAEVQALVNNIYNAPPELLRKIRVALGYQ